MTGLLIIVASAASWLLGHYLGVRRERAKMQNWLPPWILRAGEIHCTNRYGSNCQVMSVVEDIAESACHGWSYHGDKPCDPDHVCHLVHP